MDAGISERVEALRREIAEIQMLSLAYLQKPKPDFNAINDHARRSQRLTEIMDQLRSMTEWKKTYHGGYRHGKAQTSSAKWLGAVPGRRYLHYL